MRGLTFEEFENGAEVNDLFEKIDRDFEIARLKEVYSKEFLVPSLCSEEEYNRVPASTDRAEAAKRQNEIAGLMDVVVGFG